MKRNLMLLVACCAALLLSGCGAFYCNSNGFPAVPPALVFSETTRGAFMLPKAENLDNYIVLGEVEGRASMENVLFIIATGDASIAAAKRDALRVYKDAEEIINVEVDAYHKSILGLFNTSTTILRGFAVKYKKTKK